MINVKSGDTQGLVAGASLLSRPAEEFENDPSLEAMWARKAFEHAEVYFNILCSANPRILRLTPYDDEIYKLFRERFSKMAIDVVDEDEMKSNLNKPIWRGFCEDVKSVLEDYSYGTLFRIDSKGDYSEKNSTIVPRAQFLAIEIARNREGCNDTLRINFRPQGTDESSFNIKTLLK